MKGGISRPCSRRTLNKCTLLRLKTDLVPSNNELNTPQNSTNITSLHGRQQPQGIKKEKKKAKVSDDLSYGGQKRSAKKCEHYQQNPDENRGEKLKASKEMLEKVNVDIADKDLNEVIDEIVSDDNKHNHKASWKLANEVSGRKNARTAKL